MRFMRAALLALVGLGVGCGGPGGGGDGGIDGDGDIDGRVDPDGGEGGDGATDGSLAVTGVNPGHGVFAGGSSVLVRGRGFAEGARVFFGEHEARPASVQVVDDNRIACRTPGGEPGTFVDVTVVQGDVEATLEDGFYYDPCVVAPSSGSTSGGTFVTISCAGTELADDTRVTFDSMDASDVEVLSETMVTCRTPPGTVGPADVDLLSVSGDVALAEAYTYYSATDPTSGGLGGDPIDGNLEIAVFDAMSYAPLAESFVIVGVDGGTEYQGITDAMGTIVFSGPDLSGRQLIITVSHGPQPTPIDMTCDGEPDIEPDTLYETASFTEFDATFVTVLLEPIPPMVMVPPCEEPPTAVPSYIEGELLFEGPGEFGRYGWDIVPEPIPPNEEKMAFVFTSARDVFFDGPPYGDEIPMSGTPDPGPDAIVTLDSLGENGYGYRLHSRTGAVAVYALAGIVNRSTSEFTAYGFGIHRGVLVPPGETVTNVDLLMLTPLDELVQIDLDDPPTAQGWDMGPNAYWVELFVDLGIEGVIWRFDRLSTAERPTQSHFFPAWMPRQGALEDATLTVVANAYTVDIDPFTGEPAIYYPFSTRYVRGITDWQAPAVVGDWIWPAQPLDPDHYGTVQDNHMEWQSGAGEIHFHHLELAQGSPLWDLILPGEQSSVDLPPLPPEFAPSPGETEVYFWHHRVLPGFDYDSWSYANLGRNYQTAIAAHAWLVDF